MALTIPFSLLFASILLDLRHIPANLLSLGALDFGMIVEGAVVMVENILRHLSFDRARAVRWTKPFAPPPTKCSARFSTRSQSSSSRICRSSPCSAWKAGLFRPMAWTVVFALLGALIFSILLAPVLASYVFRRGVEGMGQPGASLDHEFYQDTLAWIIALRTVPLVAALVIFAVSGFLAFGGVIGSEFLPHLDEGAIWARGTLAPSTGPSEGSASWIRRALFRQIS